MIAMVTVPLLIASCVFAFLYWDGMGTVTSIRQDTTTGYMLEKQKVRRWQERVTGVVCNDGCARHRLARLCSLSVAV